MGRLELGQTGEQVQRVDVHGRTKLRADEVHVARCGTDVAVTHQSLDRDQVNPAFEQMSCKGVAQGVNAPALDNAGAVARAPVGALSGLDAQRTLAATGAEEPVTRFGGAYVGPQQLEQCGRELGVACLGPFAVLYPDTHAVGCAVNITYPQCAGLKDTQAGGVYGLQDHAMHRVGAARKHTGDFFA